MSDDPSWIRAAATNLRARRAGREVSDPGADRSAVVVAAPEVAAVGGSCRALPHPVRITTQATSATPGARDGPRGVSRFDVDSDPCLSSQPSAGHGLFEAPVVAFVLVGVGDCEIDDGAVELL